MPAKKKPAPQSATIEDLDFEDAIGRLEEIIDRMEAERIPLDSLLKEYKEGTQLLKLCRKRVEGARAQIDTITKEMAAAHPDDAADSDPADTPADDSDNSDDDIQLL